MKVDIAIWHGGVGRYPIIEGGVMLEWDRKGSPGRISFSVVKDDKASFEEGDTVLLQVDGADIFFGFIFKKSRSGQSPYLIKVTAYDQLRYFKNKDTYIYANKTASEVVTMLAVDFRLKLGTVADTGYKIPTRTEDDVALFDIVGNALDETLRAREKMYVLYDDVGELTLRDVEDMKLDLVLSAGAMGDYDYGSSIDEATYNQVKVVFENDKTKKREVYIAKDSGNMNKWGLLQLRDKVDDAANGPAKAEALLKLYNAKTRSLTVSDALGDIRVRGGSSVVVQLELGDMSLQNYMMAESVQHTFKNEEHTMTLKLRGGQFVA